MILIFEDPNYAKSVWCQSLVRGLVSELKLKRAAFRFVSSAQELSSQANEGDFVYIIGSGSGWITASLALAERAGAYPILLSNQTRDQLSINCSMVCSDTVGSMKYVIDQLRRLGKQRVAMYGVNPRSVGDASRKSSFLLAAHAPDSDIFLNDGSLENCFQSFFEQSRSYDAVICANDFAAISLVRKLSERAPEELTRLSIIGCAETRLTKFYEQHIVSIRVNFDEYGKAAVTLLDMLRKNPFLSNIVMSIRWDISALHELPKPAPAQSAAAATHFPQAADAFYTDQELTEMLCMEQLLSECDELDNKILRLALAGQAYEDIAEHCFVNVSTVKYRMRKMIGICQTENRAELLRLVEKYLPQLT